MIKRCQKVIETERLLLQPCTTNYSDVFFQLISKNRTTLMDSFPALLTATETPAATMDFIQQKIFDANNNKALAYFFFLKENTQLIGYLHIKDIDWKIKKAELAYFIDAAFCRQGITTEAVQQLLLVCFEMLHLGHVQARVDISNTASIRLLEKIGFKYEGSFFTDDKLQPQQSVETNRYGMSMEEYLRNRDS